VIFAKQKGHNRPLTAAELEMMNLTARRHRARHGDDAKGDAGAGADRELLPARRL
jgi:hypothetical protein